MHAGYLSSACAFGATGEEHDQPDTPAGEVHSPAGADMDAQFRYAGANRLDISEQAMLQPSDWRGNDRADRRIGKAVEPSTELRERPDLEHFANVIERLHGVNSQS